MNRRNAIKNLGIAVVASTVPSRVTVAEETTRSTDESVVYSDEHGEIVQVGPHSYVIRGATTERDFEFLLEKRDELLGLGRAGGKISPESHSDQDYDESAGNYQGKSWDVRTEFSATADNGVAEPSGAAIANWWGEASWYDDPLAVDKITITSIIRANCEVVDGFSISVPPSYDVSKQQREVELNEEFSDNAHPSLSHDEGTITFRADCFNYVEQDDRFKFEYETGETKFYGTNALADVGHCGDWT